MCKGTGWCRIIYLESQARANLLLQNLRDRSVKVGQDLHRQLRVDAVLRDQVIESVCEGSSHAVTFAQMSHVSDWLLSYVQYSKWFGASALRLSGRRSDKRDYVRLCMYLLRR